MAQLGADLGIAGVETHFSWPSAAQALNYAGDRDSALYSRDGLELVLRELRAAGARHVTVLAHSLGAVLVMETLRQIAIGGAGEVRRLADAVILFSPDLDVELFHAQARRIGRLPQPFVIFTSRRDRALALSARLTGRRQRLGRIEEFAALSDLEVLVLDVSAFRAGFDNHFALARSPLLQQIFRGLDRVDVARAADRAGRIGLIDGTILTLQSATAIVLRPVAEILD
jgi:esterase/lipase superfamily enzyme